MQTRETTGARADTATHEQQIRDLIEQWITGARSGDLDTVMACYTPDILAFDAIAALQFKGTEAYRKHWEWCLTHMPADGEMIMEAHDIEVSAGDNIAFASYLSRCGYIDKEGKEHAGWMRATVCCRLTPAGWRIAHEHYSVPFDPGTNKALTDLSP